MTLSFLIFAPIVLSIILAWVGNQHLSRLIGSVLVAIELIVCVGLAWQQTDHHEFSWVEKWPLLPGIAAHWHLGVDGLAAPFLPLSQLVTLAVMWGAPRAQLSNRAITQLLAGLGFLVGVYTAQDLFLLTTFWVLSLLPGLIGAVRGDAQMLERHGTRLVYIGLTLASSIPLILATILIGWARHHAGLNEPFDLSHALAQPMDGPLAPWALGALILVVLVRTGIWPLHSWFPVLVEHGSVVVARRLLGSQFGAYLALRVIVPLFGDTEAQELDWMIYLAVFSALYAAFVGLSQVHLRRALGWILMGQANLVLVGIGLRAEDGLHGALLQIHALAIGGIGLFLVVLALQARVETVDVRNLGGLMTRFPRLAGAFLIFALAMVGLPGGLSYVAEDLLLQGLVGPYTPIAIALLFVNLCNGVTLIRLFVATFLGKEREAPWRAGLAVDLLPRESVVIFGLMAVFFAAGLYPQPLIDLREDLVEALAIHGEHASLNEINGHD